MHHNHCFIHNSQTNIHKDSEKNYENDLLLAYIMLMCGL